MTRSSALRRLFPGERLIWQVAGGVFAVLGIVLLVALAQPRELFTGSNSIAGRDQVAPATSTQAACVRDVRIPAQTGRIRLIIDAATATLPAIDITARLAGGGTLHGRAPGGAKNVTRRVDVPLDRATAAGGSATATRFCVRPVRGSIFVWGRGQLDNSSKPIEVGKQRLNARVALWFLPRAHERKPILAQLGAMFERASMFRPGFVGPWTFWLLLFGVMPALMYAGIRLLATAGPSMRRLPLRVFVLAFALAASWALVTPAFESPDESEHMAAVQYFGETGKAVQASQTATAPWSTEEAWAIDQTYELSTIERADAKAPWDPFYEQRWAKTAAKSLPRDDGGGFHPATSVHTPAYYALLTPAYLAARSGSTFTQLLAMRLTSALMGALTAMLAMLIVAELLPGRRQLAVAAGLLVAFLPQFGFISGAVNNDNGVNLGAALCIYLVLRVLRRGLTVGVAIGLGAALVATPLLKGTGYELYPPAALALVALVARRHGRRDLVALAVLALSFAVCFEAWDLAKGAFDRTAFATPGGTTPGSFAATDNLRSYAVWLWQVLVPIRLPFMRDFTLVHWPFFNIYVQRGFGGFGWYAIFFPNWVYVVIVGVMAAVLGGATRLLWSERASYVRSHLPEILFLASIPIVVLCAVEAAYFTLAIPVDGTAEQGRYAFPAITALAAIVIAGCLGLGRKRAVPVATALVAGLAVMTLAGQWLTLATFYT